jgi:hypothetical protein
MSFGGGSTSYAAANLIRDTYKSFQALQNGISMIRIVQEDVWGDRCKVWRTSLQSFLCRVVDRTRSSDSYTRSSVSHTCFSFQDTTLYKEHSILCAKR